MATERPPLKDMTLRQLRKVASLYNVPRYSRMRKEQLLAAIERIETETNLSGERQVEAAKFEVGQEESIETLSSVDEDLGELPEGYGDSRIVMMPRDPQWAYTYWDVSNEHKESVRRSGGQQLALRVYDVTDLDIPERAPHSVQEYQCDEIAREWYLPIPVSDRDYVVEIGYRTADGRWLMLARSAAVRTPPVYPAEWVEDVFIEVGWEEDLREKTVYNLLSPSQRLLLESDSDEIYDRLFDMSLEGQRVSGSVFGSMQQAAESLPVEQPLSSYVFPSGLGLWALPTASGVGMFSASAAPERPQKFWLVADAELIVYGATEPDAKLTIGGRPVKLNPDGTFRFQMSFQDGTIDYPIMAVAADGVQARSIHLKFARETPSRLSNSEEDAVLGRSN